MKGRGYLLVLLLGLLVVVLGYLNRREAARERAQTLERSMREAAAALESGGGQEQGGAPATELEARIEAAARAAAVAGPPPGGPEGRCVEDVEDDARGRLGSDPEFPGQAVRRERLDDVDGDGRAEEMVSFRELCGERNCTWAIYASDRGCARHVGTMEGAAWRALEPTHHGLRDVAVTWVAGCAGAERYEGVLEYDGSEYRLIDNEYIDECGEADAQE